MRTSTWVAVLVLAVANGCGGETESSNVPPTGGPSETGPSETGPSETGPAFQLPGCLRDLVAQCSLGNACRYASTDGGALYCGASGVRAERTTVTCSGTTGENGYKVRVYKPDGSLCYSFSHTCFCGHACEQIYNFWSNATGELVAQRTDHPSETYVTCLEPLPDGGGYTLGESVGCAAAAAECALLPDLEGCSAGSCP